MIELQSIHTDRHFEKRSFYQIVYEWEDDFSRVLGLPLVPHNHSFYKYPVVLKLTGKWHLYRPLQIVDRLFSSKKKSLYFDMGPRWTYTTATSADILPIIIDFWKYININRFNKVYSASPLVCITSLEALNYLKANGCNLPLAHLALSLPDKYDIEKTTYPVKDIDIISIGRANPVFKDFFSRYIKAYPATTYLIQDFNNGLPFINTNAVNVPHAMENREVYLELIKRSKVAFYSTPGMDGGEKRTGGFNPVTPRLFELLYGGCHVIGRYPRTEETAFFDLPAICQNFNTYEEFSYLLAGYLDQNEAPFIKNADYLKNHYASRRAAELKQLLAAHSSQT